MRHPPLGEHPSIIGRQRKEMKFRRLRRIEPLTQTLRRRHLQGLILGRHNSACPRMFHVEQPFAVEMISGSMLSMDS
jgi:hypothetical protein